MLGHGLKCHRDDGEARVSPGSEGPHPGKAQYSLPDRAYDTGTIVPSPRPNLQTHPVVLGFPIRHFLVALCYLPNIRSSVDAYQQTR